MHTLICIPQPYNASKNILFSCVVFIFFFSTYSWSYDVLISVKGSIYGNTCIVSTSSENIDVPLGKIGTKQFINGNNSNVLSPFTIRLEDCGPEFTGVKVNFTGSADDYHPEFLKIAPNGATGVAIQILDKNKKQVAINNSSDFYFGEVNSNIDLLFYARVVANGQAVNAGDVSSYATWTLEYQ